MKQIILEQASIMLKHKFDMTIHLSLLETVYEYEGSPSTVIRCVAKTRNNSLPKTLIIKRFNKINDSLLYELCGLEFLAELVSNFAPKLYAYDISQKIIILEDLGDTNKHLLGNILFGDDSQHAEHALIDFNKSLAQLHLQTYGKQNQWQQLIEKHNNPTNVSRHRINHIQDAIINLPNQFKAIGITINETIQDDLNEVLDCIRQPKKFLTLVHGDNTPANAFYSKGKIRLVDFETSNFRHCLLDGSYSRMRYLHSVWAREIPLHIQHKSMNAYREKFLALQPIGEQTFNYHLVATCTAWLAGLFVLLPAVTEKDKTWGRSTNRQRIVTALQHFIVLTDNYKYFQALRSTCIEAEQKLRRIWSDEDCKMKLYPAFIDKKSY